MSAARVDYSYSQNFVNEVKRLCEEYRLSLNFKRSKLNDSKNEEDDDSVQDGLIGDDDDLDHSTTKQGSTQQKIEERKG